MKVHIVYFKAFDRLKTEMFIDETPEQMHEKLNDLCNTYQPVTITELEVKRELPVTILTNLKTKA